MRKVEIEKLKDGRFRIQDESSDVVYGSTREEVISNIMKLPFVNEIISFEMKSET